MTRAVFPPLRWVLLAVAVALLAGLSFGVSTARLSAQADSASACETTAIFSATLTAVADSEGDFTGYFPDPGGFGTLTPNTFDYNGVTYTVAGLYTTPDGSAYDIVFSATSDAEDLTALHGMSLTVGESVYDIGSPDYKFSDTEYEWNTTFNFTSGDSYTVSIAPTVTDVFCATLTAGRRDSITKGFGPGYGTLSSNTFEHSGVTYTVKSIYTGWTGSAWAVHFSASSSANNLTALHGMSLAVGERVYDIGSPDNKPSDTQYRWNTTSEFTVGQSYTVRIAPTIKATWDGSPAFTRPDMFYDSVSFTDASGSAVEVTGLEEADFSVANGKVTHVSTKQGATNPYYLISFQAASPAEVAYRLKGASVTKSGGGLNHPSARQSTNTPRVRRRV